MSTTRARGPTKEQASASPGSDEQNGETSPPAWVSYTVPPGCPTPLGDQNFSVSSSTLSLRFRSPFPNRHPTFVPRSTIDGTVDFDIAKAKGGQKVKYVIVRLVGKSKSEWQNEGGPPDSEWEVVREELKLFADGKLPVGTTSLPFSLSIPLGSTMTGLTISSFYGREQETHTPVLPPSFYAPINSHQQRIVYHLEVECKKGVFSSPEFLRAPIVLAPFPSSPSATEPRGSVAAEQAEELPIYSQIEDQGVHLDTEEWVKKEASLVLSAGKEGRLTATFSIPTTKFKLGTSLPFLLELQYFSVKDKDEGSDEIMLDLVTVGVPYGLSAKAPKRLLAHARILNMHISGSETTGGVGSESFYFSRCEKAKTWRGEVKLDALGLSSTFSTPNVKSSWSIRAQFNGPALASPSQLAHQITLVAGPPESYTVHPGYFVDHERPKHREGLGASKLTWMHPENMQ
ncbi:hypothetical protein BT69DRAFT_1276346 [Atractiella rhizophila]|nr:hypothetical protein BT69DRAFT_1276346 [Atractiella rhizophila]